jgi:hypothetical protein
MRVSKAKAWALVIGTTFVIMAIAVFSYLKFWILVRHIRVPNGARVEYRSGLPLGRQGYNIEIVFPSDKPVDYQVVLKDVPATGCPIEVLIGLNPAIEQALRASDSSVAIKIRMGSKERNVASKFSKMRFERNAASHEALGYGEDFELDPDESSGKSDVELHFVYSPTGDLPKGQEVKLVVRSGGFE